ncbi:GCN5-related N-acetyltransferase [Actinoplanes friuliensis DSM 7358]|uniref:GCN5-related N-acetyltransferase n=1 Tax=Actinoplanes friuliensis DSM 7358 TaxID=1246995 RepID=U5W2E2_9ACTN|nr:GCN5-related N-acetyltransferase [Actinoplanes friuliensis DSM 7358]
MFLDYEHDEEAAELAHFPPRERDRFMTHWKTRVLGVPENLVQTVTVGGETAGNILAWWDADRRFLGYWFGRRFWGQGIGTRALGLFLELEQTRPLHADPAARNIGSVRVLEKHGFQRTETLDYDGTEHILLTLT